MTTLFNKIKEVTELKAAAGFETPVRDYLRKTITPLVDEAQTDGLGGIFGIKNSAAENAPRIMVSSIVKRKMPLRCSWLPTWMKLGL